MSYIIQLDGLSFQCKDLDINRTPPFAYLFGVYSKDLVGVIHGDKWDSSDENVDYFQVRFSTYNIKTVLQKILECFSNGTVFSVETPLANFSHAIIQQATIDNENISVSLIAKNPSSGTTDLKSDICLSTDANYAFSTPGFVQVFQFGNYIAISTHPFKLTRNLVGGTKIISTDYIDVFKMPINTAYSVYTFQINSFEGYCYTNAPPLMTPVIVQPTINPFRYNYAFGLHPSCELSAYLKVKDLTTGRIWYQSGNSGTLQLADGTFELTPIVALPTDPPQYIEGETLTIVVSKEQPVLGFLTPETTTMTKGYQIYAYDDLILHFKGWKTFEIAKNSTLNIAFDYPGTYHCIIYSKTLNDVVTELQIQVAEDRVVVGNTLSDSLYTKLPNVDVFFHEQPLANKPTLVSIDGPFKSITFEDANVVQISSNLYEVTFNSSGYKKITITLENDLVYEKIVGVSIGYSKLLEKIDDSTITTTSQPFYMIVSSPSYVDIIPPNSTIQWTEYSFGFTPVNITILNGSDIQTVQYQFNMANPDAFKIVYYDGILQLLHPPNTDTNMILWYIGNSFIGAGDTIQIPPLLPPGTYTVTAKVYGHNGIVKEISATINYDGPHANQLQLQCQIINPKRLFDLESTNRLVTIHNCKPVVTYRYLDTTLNISLAKYLYLERYTYVGIVDDLSW